MSPVMKVLECFSVYVFSQTVLKPQIVGVSGVYGWIVSSVSIEVKGSSLVRVPVLLSCFCFSSLFFPSRAASFCLWSAVLFVPTAMRSFFVSVEMRRENGYIVIHINFRLFALG